MNALFLELLGQGSAAGFGAVISVIYGYLSSFLVAKEIEDQLFAGIFDFLSQ